MNLRKWLFAMFLCLFPLVFLGGGVWILVQSSQDMQRCRKTAMWPTTPGTLVNVSIEEMGENTYEVKVKYTYQVDDVPYEGDRVAFGYSSGARERQEEIQQKLNVAKAIAVRYDPANPAIACLSSGLSIAVLQLVLLGVILIVNSILAMIFISMTVMSETAIMADLLIQRT